MTANGYSLGVVVTLPLFDGFMRENAVKTAKAKLDRAVQAEGLARQQISSPPQQNLWVVSGSGKAPRV